MILRAENQLLYSGIESVYGTAVTLVASNAVQCDFEVVPMEAAPKERKYSRPYAGANPVILTEVHRKMKMKNMELAGSGAVATAPPWTPLLRGCGWAAVTTGTGTVFNPVTKAVDSLTISPSIDGEQFKLTGARGTATFNFDISETPMIEIDYTGKWVDPLTLSLPLMVPDYSAWKIPIPVNCANTAAIMIDGVSYPFYSHRITQGSEVEFYCVPGETQQRVELGKRVIKSVVKIQAKQVSEHNLFLMAKSNALVPVSMMHGTVAGTKLGVAGPKVQLLNPRPSAYKSDLAWEIDLLWTPDIGNDELILSML